MWPANKISEQRKGKTRFPGPVIESPGNLQKR